jgi:hypothetical protein
MVIVDLAAACVTAPRTLARKLRAPALAFEQTGRCLLLVGAPPELVTELDRADVRGTVFAAGSLPLPAV